MSKITIKQLLATVSEALERDGGEVTVDTKMCDTEEWDSLAHLGILSGLDELTDGATSEVEKIAECKSVADFIVRLRDGGLLDESE